MSSVLNAPTEKNLTPRRILWFLDPWKTLDHAKDTSLRLAEEAETFGVESYFATTEDLLLTEKGLTIRARRLLKKKLAKTPSLLGLADFEQIHWRIDPPVDLHYTQPLQILIQGISMLPPGSPAPELINPPAFLFARSEKLALADLAREFPTTVAPMLASANSKDLLDFVKAQEVVILKPFHHAQSKEIRKLSYQPSARKTLLKTLERLTQKGQIPVLLQAYLPAITTQGETRLWFIDGVLLACAKKHPKKGTYLINMDNGGKLGPASLNRDETRTALDVSRYLKKHGLRLVAVDLIDSKITDFNFTSPGLLVSMEKLLDKNLARPIIQKLLGGTP